MPFFLIFLGIVFLLVGANDKTDTFHQLLAEDVLGANGKSSVAVWFLAVILIALVGLAKPLRPFAEGFLVLIMVVVIIGNEGFIDKFRQQTGL